MGIYPYQTREVRDLAWACFAPPLLVTRELGVHAAGAGNCAFPLSGGRQLWLEKLDRDATPLLEHLSSIRSQRLGLYFESLWHFFLAQDEEVDLVARNLPVNRDGRTIGEFDCLYFCRRRNCHVHLELAVKFYLGWPTQTEPGDTSLASEWLGPNARDRLDIKDIVIASEGLVRVVGDMSVNKGELDGRFKVGVVPGTLSHIPGAETKVFLRGEKGLLWAPLRITGTLEDPKEDLTEKRCPASFPPRVKFLSLLLPLLLMNHSHLTDCLVSCC